MRRTVLCRLVAVVLAAAVAVAGVMSAAPAAHAATFTGYAMAFQAPDHHEWNIRPDGSAIRTPSVHAPNTSPSIAGLPDGTWVTAFVAADLSLWVGLTNSGGRRITPVQLSVRPNTSATVAANASGAWMVTFQDTTGRQWFYRSTGLLSQTPSFLAPGTTPQIAALPNGTFQTAFSAADRTLWVANSNGAGNRVTNAFLVQHNTSPAIAVSRGGQWRILVQAESTRLWEVDQATNQVDETPWAAQPGRSPAIVRLSSSGFAAAFVASDGVLWRTDPFQSGPTGLRPGGSPAIAANLSSGYRVAFGGATDGLLWTIDSSRTAAVTTGLPISAGTGAGITAITRP